MNHLVVFAFVLIISSVTGQDALEQCIIVADTATDLNVPAKCDYMADAIRCGINNLGLAEDDATTEEIESGRARANQELSKRDCIDTFDDILKEVKAKPELLEIQECMDKAIEEDFKDGHVNPCSHVEDGVRCGIRAWKLYEENASEDEMMYGRQFATRYLSPYGCKQTFYDLLTEVKNSGPTVSPIGWFTAVMAAFIVMFTTV